MVSKSVWVGVVDEGGRYRRSTDDEMEMEIADERTFCHFWCWRASTVVVSGGHVPDGSLEWHCHLPMLSQALPDCKVIQGCGWLSHVCHLGIIKASHPRRTNLPFPFGLIFAPIRQSEHKRRLSDTYGSRVASPQNLINGPSLKT